MIFETWSLPSEDSSMGALSKKAFQGKREVGRNVSKEGREGDSIENSKVLVTGKREAKGLGGNSKRQDNKKR